MSPFKEPVKSVVIVALVAVVAEVAFPFKLAVIVAAEKLPEASRDTIAFARLALFAVVAELVTLPAVVIVASLESLIAADELISAFVIKDVENAPEELLCTTPAVFKELTTKELLIIASLALMAAAAKLPAASLLTIVLTAFVLVAFVLKVISLALFVTTISDPADNDLKLSVVPVLSLKTNPAPAPTFAPRIISGKEKRTKEIGSVSIIAVGVTQSQLEPAFTEPEEIRTYA